MHAHTALHVPIMPETQLQAPPPFKFTYKRGEQEYHLMFFTDKEMYLTLSPNMAVLMYGITYTLERSNS